MSRITLPRVVVATLLAQLPMCRCGSVGTATRVAMFHPFPPVTHHTCDSCTVAAGAGDELPHAWAIREARAALKAGEP